MPVTFNTGANLAEGKSLLARNVQEIVNATEAQSGLEDNMSKLGFVLEPIVLVDGVITSMVGPEPLKEVAEDGVAALASVMEGWSKGYKLKEYMLKHKCTKVFSKWLDTYNGGLLSEVDSSVKTELNKFKDEIQQLVYGNILTRNQVMADVFALAGVGTEAYGPGSLLGDGQPLVSTAHVVKKTGAVFSNRMPAGSALSATTIEAAIQSYKTVIRMPNGYRVRTPEIFTLAVGRAQETTARKILNSGGDQAGVYAGSGSNANLLNVFSFQGSKVRLEVIDEFGQPREDGSIIGNDAMWFLINTEFATRYKAFRVFSLWDKEITAYKNDETGSYNTIISTYFTADAFNAEALIGYLGD
jgi:hypothetical protein